MSRSLVKNLALRGIREFFLNPRQAAQKARSARPQRVKIRGVPSGYVEGLNDARTPLAGFFSSLLIGSLSVFEELVHDGVFLFWIFVIFERLTEIIYCALSLPLLGIVFGNAVVGPSIFLVAPEGSIEGFIRFHIALFV